MRDRENQLFIKNIRENYGDTFFASCVVRWLFLNSPIEYADELIAHIKRNNKIDLNMKKKITESQLRDIIAESVKKVLNEGQGDLLTVGELKSILSECNDEDFIAFVPEDSKNAYRVLTNYSINEFRWNGYDDGYDDEGRNSVNLIMRRG